MVGIVGRVVDLWDGIEVVVDEGLYGFYLICYECVVGGVVDCHCGYFGVVVLVVVVCGVLCDFGVVGVDVDVVGCGRYFVERKCVVDGDVFCDYFEC